MPHPDPTLRIPRRALAPALLLSLCLSGCPLDGSSSSAIPGSGSATTSSYSVAGSLSGLAGGASVGLALNGSASLLLSANGAFAFDTPLSLGSSYTVSVTTQPTGQRCTVTQGSGTVAAPVGEVQVSCLDLGLSVLHTFSGGADGQSPETGRLLLDSAGNLYGSSYGDGTANAPGTVFELSPDGSGGYTESVLYRFSGGSDGQSPSAGLILDSGGNLYGTTYAGGDANGDGTVFRLAPNGAGGYTESVLYRFGGSPDGANPSAGLVMDSQGHLFGTTVAGGPGNYGTAFELSPNGSGGYVESVIYDFSNVGGVGQGPEAPLVIDSAGRLFGTTYGGGASGYGVVFELTPNGSGGYTESVLHSFASGVDGRYTEAGVTLDASGNLYGTTVFGGQPNDSGTVFKLSPDGSGGYTESILLAFAGGTDGAVPVGEVTLDSGGNVFGTTYEGGPSGNGTIFRLSPDGSGGYAESQLYAFTGGADGAGPYPGVVIDPAGNLYGTASIGGNASGYGTVFRFVP